MYLKQILQIDIISWRSWSTLEELEYPVLPKFFLISFIVIATPAVYPRLVLNRELLMEFLKLKQDISAGQIYIQD